MTNTNAETIRVALLDSHAAVRLSIAQCFCNEPDLVMVGSYASGRESLCGLLAAPADVVLLEYAARPDDIHGNELVQIMKRIYPELVVVVFSSHDDLATITSALQAGACGYIHKRTPLSELTLAVRTAAKGQTYVRIAPA